MKILSVDQFYEADKVTVRKQQLDPDQLMERAGHRIFEWLESRLVGSQIPIHIFCGIGDNGGDGMVVGRLLIENGYNVTVYVVNYSKKHSKNFLLNYDRIKYVTKKWPIIMTGEHNFPKINKEDIVIDAIFGMGLNRCPEGWVKELIAHLNQSEAFKLAIDIPSGLFANRALIDRQAVIKADQTLTLQAPKLAFYLPETAAFVSGFDVLEIGLDDDFITNIEPLGHLISQEAVQRLYIFREKFDHKGSYGHALIVGGSYGKIGAAILSTNAAFRIGAGLVTVFVPKCGYNILQTSIPEAMVVTDKEEGFISAISTDFTPTAIAVGMGIGKNKETIEALKRLFKKSKVPFVIDADALNNISEDEELLKALPKNSILTPHPGELSRLIGPWENDYEKLDKVKEFSKKHGVVVIIKGANTITVYDEKLYINTTGNPGMATAGSGDALSGVIVGLLCQGYDILSASLFGVFMHGFAGDNAAKKLGFEAIMAGDIINNLSEAYMELFVSKTSESTDELDEEDDY